MWNNLREVNVEKGWVQKKSPFLGLFIIRVWLGTQLSFLTAEGSCQTWEQLWFWVSWFHLLGCWYKAMVLQDPYLFYDSGRKFSVRITESWSAIQDCFSPTFTLPVLLCWLHHGSSEFPSFPSFRITFWHCSWWMKIGSWIASLIILFPVCFNYASFPVGVKQLFWSHWFKACKICTEGCV